MEYDRRFLTWWGISLFAFHLGARRLLDFDLRDIGTEVLATLNRLAETRQETLPVHKTLDHFLLHLGGAEAVEELRTKMVRRLLRQRVLEGCRLNRKYVIAIDGSGWLAFGKRHCEHCLVQKCGDGHVYLHNVLEAKLIGPQGLALSIGTEFIENVDMKAVLYNENVKQDAELKAMARLLPAMRTAFPKLPMILTADSLYGCGTAIQLAEDHNCSYVYVFKPGRLPAVWQDFQSLLPLCPENTHTVRLAAGTRRVYRWVNDMSYVDSHRREHTFHAIQCEETNARGTTATYAWMTPEPVSARTVEAIGIKGGRRKQNIENGFNIQKNGGMRMEHAYSTRLPLAKAYYGLLQIAHIIQQLLLLGSPLKNLAARAGKTPIDFYGSIKKMVQRLLECMRYVRLPPDVFDTASARRMQIRFGFT